MFCLFAFVAVSGLYPLASYEYILFFDTECLQDLTSAFVVAPNPKLFQMNMGGGGGGGAC